jgi:hypothetical protein
MDTYSVETDGSGGLVVKVARDDGEVWITLPDLRSWSDAQEWIQDHRRIWGDSVPE